MAWDHDSVYNALASRKLRVGKIKPPGEYKDPYVVLYEQSDNCAILYSSASKHSSRRKYPAHMFVGRPGWQQEVLDRLLEEDHPAMTLGYDEHNGWRQYSVTDWGAFAAAVGLSQFPTVAELDSEFHDQVERELRNGAGAADARARDEFPAVPRMAEVTVRSFIRNPRVAARALMRAKGICEHCSCPAPFTRRSDGTPYLEVHHKMPLADGGLDVIENAIALCPNCHRKAHYG